MDDVGEQCCRTRRPSLLGSTLLCNSSRKEEAAYAQQYGSEALIDSKSSALRTAIPTADA